MNNEFGPQTYQIKKVLEKFKTLSLAQIKALAASWDASWDASRSASWDASRSASRDASLAASWAASWSASRDASLAASRSASRDASLAASRSASRDASRTMRDVVEALHSRDLIGKKFTQAHYDYLVLPWRQIVGEFEEPPTVESLEKRVDALEKSVKYGYIPSSYTFYSPGPSSSTYNDYLVILEQKKRLARKELQERYNKQTCKLDLDYRAELDKIERML